MTVTKAPRYKTEITVPDGSEPVCLYGFWFYVRWHSKTHGKDQFGNLWNRKPEPHIDNELVLALLKENHERLLKLSRCQ